MTPAAPTIEKTLTDIKPSGAVVRHDGRENRMCPICGGTLEKSASELFDTRFGVAGRYGTERCVACAYEQIDPVPAAQELKRLYESQYNFAGADTSRYVRWRERFLFSFLNRSWMKLDGDIAFHLRRGRGRLLDVGCNEGRGLRFYSRNGFTVEGLELNEVAAAEARKCGFTVHTSLLETFQPKKRFDVAVLSNVLEHSPAPRAMLHDVRRILNPGGRVWISCPNSESWQRKFFGRHWINWHVPFHISFFSSASLKKLLAETGFATVESAQISPSLWIAQTCIALLFAKERKKNKQLRNPLLTAALMLSARALVFPALWWGNHKGRGDCLIFVATAK